MHNYRVLFLTIGLLVFGSLNAMDFSDRPEDVLQRTSLAKVVDNTDNWTALHDISFRGNLDAIKRFLAATVEKERRNTVNAVDKYNQTPVWWAARAGKSEALRLLIDAGGDVMYRDFQGRTPLHVAVKSKKREPVVLLLRRGAYVDATDEAGSTPLHYVCNACSSENVWINETLGELADVLITAGANMRFGERTRWSPLSLATQGTGCAVLAACIKHGASVDEVVHTVGEPVKLAFYLKRECSPLLHKNTAWNDWTNKMIKAYLVSHAKRVYSGGSTILHQFSDSAEFEQCDAELNAEFVESLINADARMRLVDECGRSPIYLASRSRFYPVLAVYIAHGATIEEAASGMGTSSMIAFARYLKHNHSVLLNRFSEWDQWVREKLLSQYHDK